MSSLYILLYTLNIYSYIIVWLELLYAEHPPFLQHYIPFFQYLIKKILLFYTSINQQFENYFIN